MNGRAVGPLIIGVTISRGFTPGQEDDWALGPKKQRFPSESGAVELTLNHEAAQVRRSIASSQFESTIQIEFKPERAFSRHPSELIHDPPILVLFLARIILVGCLLSGSTANAQTPDSQRKTGQGSFQEYPSQGIQLGNVDVFSRVQQD